MSLPREPDPCKTWLLGWLLVKFQQREEPENQETGSVFPSQLSGGHCNTLATDSQETLVLDMVVASNCCNFPSLSSFNITLKKLFVIKLGMLAQAFNPSTWEVEAGNSL